MLMMWLVLMTMMMPLTIFAVQYVRVRFDGLQRRGSRLVAVDGPCTPVSGVCSCVYIMNYLDAVGSGESGCGCQGEVPFSRFVKILPKQVVL